MLGTTGEPATLTPEERELVKAKIVAGAANNQLANEDIHGPMCQENNILYAPDFLINAGGVMNVYGELMGYSREMVFEKTEDIFDTTLSIFELAESEGVHTQLAAMKLAQKRIETVGKIKLPL